MKKIFKIALTAVLFTITLSYNISAAETGTYEVSGDLANTYASLVEATTAINGDGGANYTISVTGETLESATSTIASGKNVTLRSKDSKYAITKNNTGRLMNVSGNLTIENIIIDGAGIAQGLHITNGSLVIDEGTIFRNNVNVSGPAIYAEKSSVTMNGGEVSNNSNGIYTVGGGVYLLESTLDMYGGSIHHNSSPSAGGVYVSIDSTFTMYAGEITNNTATSSSAGGGAIQTYAHGTFIMNGGTLAYNQSAYMGGAIYAHQGTHSSTEPSDWSHVIINTGDIHNNTASYGGGIAASVLGNVEINDGIIHDNTASTAGGGLYLSYSGFNSDGVTLDMYGGKIYNNTAPIGGGIAIADTIGDKLVANIIGTSKQPAIYENTATLYGGGVAILQRAVNPGGGVTLNMKNVSISNNETAGNGGGLYSQGSNEITLADTNIEENEADNGGGIYLTQGANLTNIKNLQILNNDAHTNGGGIFTNALSQTSITGSTKIEGNSAISGGGIFTEDYSDYDALTSTDYQNIIMDNTTAFSKNTARASYFPPIIASTYSNIKYASSSISNNSTYLNVINNFDINYTATDALTYFTIVYNANGGAGEFTSVELATDPYNVLSLEDTGITRDGYKFIGWSLTPTGNIDYLPNALLDEVIVDGTVITLYAQWEKNTDVTTEVEDTNKPSMNDNTDKEITSPSTGDNTNLLSYGMFVAGSILTLMVLIIKKINKQKLENK